MKAAADSRGAVPGRRPRFEAHGADADAHRAGAPVPAAGGQTTASRADSRPGTASSPDTVERSRAVYLETYGCQMNEYDSGIALQCLADRGYRRVARPDDAGVILLNTCAIRENAHQKVYGRLQSFSGLKRRHKQLVVGVLGCMAQNLGDDLFAMGLPLDLLVGPDNLRELPDLVEQVRTGDAGRVQRTRLSIHETYEELEPCVVSGRQAFVTIMRGCDNFCSFCVVPYTRGRERSRSAESIVNEIGRLVEQESVREVTLLGQNVNSYRHAGGDFAELIRRILGETAIERIRFTSPHPHDFPRHLLELMAAEERFCSSIHLPVQSGSSRVLAAMRRDYTREQFLQLVDEIRSVVGDVGLSTDVITGFPGETEADFEDTLSLMEAVRFDMAFMFRYSERENTFAKKKLPDDVPEASKLARLQRLIARQTEIGAELNQGQIGRTHAVLVEGHSKRSQDQLMGRSSTNKVVIFPVPAEEQQALLGRTVPVVIEDSTAATLRGRRV